MMKRVWLEPNEAFSNVAGWISLACWIIVLMPQIYTNYKRKSSDALSLSFVVIWLAGDLFNLAGSALQGLLKTMIILAGYYVLADFVLICQVIYYRRQSHVMDEETVSDEYTPLVQNDNNSEKPRRSSEAAKLLFQIILVCITGTAGYLLSSHEPSEEAVPQFSLIPQIFGWTSALLYLGSRIPQIHKNYKNKSCDGLALGMFTYAVLGNVTYCVAILFHSTDPSYLLVNLSWMVGSAGTMFLDFVIFAQFYMYSGKSISHSHQDNDNV